MKRQPGGDLEMEEKTTVTGNQEGILDSVSEPQSEISQNESGQNFFSSMPYHVAFAFLIPLLIGILGVYAQGRNKNLFETNSANIWMFLLNTLFYCFALAADLKYQHHHQTSYSQLFSPAAIISGSLSSASVVSILLGDIILVLWASVPVIIAYQHATLIKSACNWLLEKIKHVTLIKSTCSCLKQKIKKTMSKFWAIWNRLKGSNLVEQSQLPV